MIFLSIKKKCVQYFRTHPYHLLYLIPIVFSFGFGFFQLFSQVTFGFDQARDAFESYAMWHDRHLKIIGPSSDLPGVNHGVLWYYVLALPYLLANGDPQITVVIFFILSFFTVFLIGHLAYKLFNNPEVSLISMSLYACSPLYQVNSRWLSNPSIALFVAPFFLLFLWRYISHQSKFISGFLGIFIGLLVQSNFSYGVIVLVLPIYFIVFKLRVKFLDIFFFLIGLLISVSTFIISEIKYKGQLFHAILHFLQVGNTLDKGIFQRVFLFLERINNFFSVTFFPIHRVIFIFIVAIIFLYFLRNKNLRKYIKQFLFLVVWLSNIVFFQFFSSGVVSSFYLFNPSLMALIILFGFFLFVLIKKHKIFYFLLISIFTLQIATSYSWIYKDFSPLSVQHGIYLSDEKQIIDYTYLSANKKPFIINVVTNPLYIDTTWAYLYEFYGQKKYGYMPFLYGRSQKGFLGNLPEKNFGINNRFFITEPDTGIPRYFMWDILQEEDTVSDMVEEKKIGNFYVQKRIFRENRPPLRKKSQLYDSLIVH